MAIGVLVPGLSSLVAWLAWVAWAKGSTHSLVLSDGPSYLKLLGNPWDFYILVLLGLPSYTAG